MKLLIGLFVFLLAQSVSAETWRVFEVPYERDDIRKMVFESPKVGVPFQCDQIRKGIPSKTSGICTITRNGDEVTIDRTKTSNNDDCKYVGKVYHRKRPDGTYAIDGRYTCKLPKPDNSWSAMVGSNLSVIEGTR